MPSKFTAKDQRLVSLHSHPLLTRYVRIIKYVPCLLNTPVVQINFENEISLRFLKLKYINARQNITYDCSNGMEAYEKLQLLTNNGDMIKYGDKQLRVVSEVRMCMYVCVYI